MWTKRVERWRDSGLSATEFAAEIGVEVNSLRHWGWRLKGGRQRAESKPSAMQSEALTWVEVTTPKVQQETTLSPAAAPTGFADEDEQCAPSLNLAPTALLTVHAEASRYPATKRHVVATICRMCAA